MACTVSEQFSDFEKLIREPRYKLARREHHIKPNLQTKPSKFVLSSSRSIWPVRCQSNFQILKSSSGSRDILAKSTIPTIPNQTSQTEPRKFLLSSSRSTWPVRCQSTFRISKSSSGSRDIQPQPVWKVSPL